MATRFNYETCYEIASQCKTLTEFHNRSDAAWRHARDNGWLPDYDWFVPTEVLRREVADRRRIWTYEKVRELASHYFDYTTFCKDNPSAATIAKRRGWMETFDWLKRRYDRPMQLMPKQPAASDAGLKTRELELLSGMAYTSETHSVYAFVFPEFRTAYVGLTVHPAQRLMGHLSDKSPVYRFAAEHGVPVPEMKILRSSLSVTGSQALEKHYVDMYLESGWSVLNRAPTGVGRGSVGAIAIGSLSYRHCYECARSCTTLKEFRKKFASEYCKAIRKHWSDDYTWLERMLRPGHRLSFEYCLECARQCTSLKEFDERFKTAAAASRRAGWLHRFDWLDTAFRYTEENLAALVGMYRTVAEFRKANPAAYNRIRKNRWWHLLEPLEKYYTGGPKGRRVAKCGMDGNILEIFESARKAAYAIHGRGNGALIACLNGKLRTHAGFRWKYI